MPNETATPTWDETAEPTPSWDDTAAVAEKSAKAAPTYVGRGDFAVGAGAESVPLVSRYSPAEKAGMEADIKSLESPLVSPNIVYPALRGTALGMTAGLSEIAPRLTDVLFPKAHAEEVTTGLEKGAADIASSLTTPTNLALLAAGGPISKLGKMGTVLMSSAFEAQALRQAPEQWKQFQDAIASNDYGRATEVGTALLGGVTLPAAAVATHGAAAPNASLAETLFPTEKSATAPEEVIPNAIEKGPLEQGGIVQHPATEEGRPATEASGSDRAAQSGEIAQEVTAQPPATPTAKLLPGETQGDLISSTQPEDLKLVGENGTDYAALQTEAEAKAQASEEARLKAEHEQGLLSDLHDYQAAGGDELLSALRDAGGLPAVYAADHPLSGELNALREEFEKSSKYTQQKFAKAGEVNFGDVFSAKGRQDIDQLTQDLRAKGFDVQTPSDLISLVQDRLRSGKPVYGNEARGAALERESMFGFGPGAAAVEEIPQAKEVSIRNGRVDQERTARGELPLMQPARKAMGKTWDEGMKRLEANPNLGTEMVTDILDGRKREVSESDHAVLINEKIRVMNERSMEADRASDPNATEEDRVEAHARWAALEDRINDIDHATQQAGTTSGRALQFRNALAKDDYIFVGMERRARAAKGRPLTEEESADIKAKADQVAKADQSATDRELNLDEQRSEASAESALSDFKKRAPKETKPIDRDKLLGQIKGAITEGADPKDLSSYIQRIALSFVRDGITERDPLVNAVHDFTKDVTGFDPRQTRDAISGYGDFKPLDKETAKVQLRQIKGEAQQISKLEDMAKGEAPLKTGLERRTPSDEERALIKQVNEAKKAGGFNVTDPATQLKSALEAVKTRLGNQIKDLQRQIDTGVRDIKERRATPTDAEAEALKVKRDELKKQFDEIFGGEISDAQRLARAKSYLTRRATELDTRIASNDFAPRAKPEPVKLDAEGTRLKANVERLKEQFDRGLMADRLKNRTPFEKMQDTFVKWRRGFVLSSPITLAKLTSAAFERMAFTPLEETVGAGLSKIPGLSRVAERAPREGSMNVTAEAKAFTEGFTKGMSDAWKTIKTGKSDLDSLFGKKDVMPRSAIDFIGSIHGALKTVTKRNEFARSLEKRAASALKDGIDITDPFVQTRLAVDAYKDANRSIFLQDNRVVQFYKRGMSALEQPNKETGRIPFGSKVAATTMRTLLPIVKVPTNIVAETMQYAVGSVTGSLRLANAFRNGIANLPPEQADLIMRELKKGSVGAAGLLIGYLNADKIGGYYQPGKRDKEDVKFGAVKVFDYNVPSYLIHNPLLETLQIGATARRVADSKLHKHDEETQGIGAGLTAGALGLAQEVPFFREMFGELPKLFDQKERGQFLGELTKSIVVPQASDWAARQLDKNSEGEVNKRAPETILQNVETAVPGLRRNVPLKEEKRRRR